MSQHCIRIAENRRLIGNIEPGLHARIHTRVRFENFTDVVPGRICRRRIGLKHENRKRKVLGGFIAGRLTGRISHRNEIEQAIEWLPIRRQRQLIDIHLCIDKSQAVSIQISKPDTHVGWRATIVY